MSDAGRLNAITARFRDAGMELRLHEPMPGAWEAIWHPPDAPAGARTAAGPTMAAAAEAALAALEDGPA
ncbi:MAG: hypothetical protein U0237_15000 [Thermoleophilia bacterium]